MKLLIAYLRFTVILTVLSNPAPSWSLARWPDNNTALGGNLANNVVTVIGGGGGTGTVLHKKDDTGMGQGAWLCVLTADHVTRGANNFTVGFNNGQTYKNFGVGSTQFFSISGPTFNNGLVDLAILTFYAPDRTLLPALANVPLAGAAVGDNVILAGYGDTNITAVTGGVNPPGPARSYQVKSSYGTMRTGVDSVENTGANYTRGIYTFQAMQGFLDFAPKPPPAVWPPTSGDAYVLSGDSGGPSFLNGKLVGVHSGSQSRFAVGIEYVDERSRWSDVDMGVANYSNWVTGLCEAVPEPSSLVAMITGGFALLFQSALSRKRST